MIDLLWDKLTAISLIYVYIRYLLLFYAGLWRLPLPTTTTCLQPWRRQDVCTCGASVVASPSRCPWRHVSIASRTCLPVSPLPQSHGGLWKLVRIKRKQLQASMFVVGSMLFKSWQKCGYLLGTKLRWKKWEILLCNPLWPSDITWWQKSGSTLTQVMACCLTTSNHYLNHCWLIISEVQ